MRISTALRQYLIAKGWVPKEPTDEACQLAVTNRLAIQDLTQAKVNELNAAPNQDQQGGGGLRTLIKGIVEDTIQEQQGTNNGGKRTVSTKAALGGGGSGAHITVHKASHRYGTTKSVGKHATTREPVINPLTGQEAELLSGAEKAKCGAYWKWLGRKSGLPVSWSQHDQELFNELVAEDEWVGTDRAGEDFLGSGERVKALLDDSVTGGISLAPVVVDLDFVQQLLLTGELFPYVDLKELPRGRRIETPVVGIPSATWGIPENTSIPLFDTTNLVSEIDSNVTTVTAAVEFGRDLLQDAALAVGDILQASVGQRMMAELDKVIAVGDGVTQPLGIFNTAGVTVATSVGGAGGPVTIADLEALIFGVSKPYRTAYLSPAFIANDVTYRRFRSIPTATAWNTLALGMDLQSYNLLQYPFRVYNGLANNQAAFVGLRKYRLWRRQGFEPRIVTEGKDLALRNVNLLIVRGRFAGKLLDASAAVLMNTLQT